MVYFIDANIFLEIQLNDEKSGECKEFIRKIDANKIDAVTSDFIVYTCLIQIFNKTKSPEKMNNFMTFLTNLEKLEIIRPSQAVISKAVENTKKYKLDFDDALVVACVTENKIDSLVSFDKDFDKVEDLKRVEPKNIV